MIHIFAYVTSNKNVENIRVSLKENVMIFELA